MRKSDASEAWVSDIIQSMNSLYGRGDGSSCPLALSTAQRAGVAHIRSIVRDAGPPTLSTAAAHHVLCGSRVGYCASHEASSHRPYQRELVALPSRGATADGADLLTGQALIYWLEWSRHLLRDKAIQREHVQPYIDQALIRDKKQYATFIGDLMSSNLVRLAKPTKPTLGIFFVAKGEHIRMIFDTRRVNQEFVAPAYSQLPTTGAWEHLELDAGEPLCLAQLDVSNAFYQMRVPAGLEDYFVLPAVDADVFREVCPQFAGAVPDFGTFSPLLRVLPMGWSWSLYFCQSMVEAAVIQAGFPHEDLVRDRHAQKAIDTTCLAAVYVDGVAVLATKPEIANARIQQIKGILESKGLLCKGIVPCEAEQSFTGLCFEKDAGKVRLTRSRLWKTRLALKQVLINGWASGEELQVLIGHYTWSCLLRRPLLSILQSVYKFISKAGPHRMRLWTSVRRELFHASSLLCFAFVDARRPYGEMVAATDASGSSSIDAGGFAMVEQPWDLALVRDTSKQGERWRYAIEDAICARAFSLESEPDAKTFDSISFDASTGIGEIKHRSAPGTLKGTTTFTAIGRDAIGDFEGWQLRVRGRFGTPENIMRLEGRALTMGLRHRLRALANRGKRWLCLCDNLSLVLSLAKGRSASPVLNSTIREVLCLSIIGDVQWIVRWIPSEHNPSDRGSRLIGPTCRQPGSCPRDAQAMSSNGAQAASNTEFNELTSEIERLARHRAKQGILGLTTTFQEVAPPMSRRDRDLDDLDTVEGSTSSSEDGNNRFTDEDHHTAHEEWGADQKVTRHTPQAELRDDQG